jgi:hypothetical protein
LLLFGFLQHQETSKTNSCTNLHHVLLLLFFFFFFCCCCCCCSRFTAEEVQLAQKKLFFKGGEISNSLHPFLFCFCLPDDTKDEESKAHVMLDKEESKARVMLDTQKKTQIPKPSTAAKNHPSHPPDDYQVFQSSKNFWKRRRVAKTDCTGKK